MIPRNTGVRPSATLAEGVGILTELGMGDAPVVTSDGAVIGIISEFALIDVVFDPSAKHEPVSKYMNPDVHVVHPDDPLARPAELFALYSFQRLPVVEEGKFVGLVTLRDLLHHALRTGDVLADPLTDLIPSLAPVT